MVERTSFSLEVVMLRFFSNQLCVFLQSESQSLSLPRIAVDVDIDKNIESALKRGIHQWVNISPCYAEQIKTIGNATRYPEQWMIAVVYTALFSASEGPATEGWYPLESMGGSTLTLAFDHAAIIHSCVKRLRNKAQYTSLPLHLAEKEFTLSDAQRVYESLLQKKLEKKSFRRRLLDANILHCLNKEKRTQTRPAQLYSLSSGHIVHHFSRNMLGKNKEVLT
jgi:8-oxo-dGTP diphosphatase